jgi:hypothetical protein
MQSCGGSGYEWRGMVVTLCVKSWKSRPERAAGRFVENSDAHVEEGLQGPSVPSHLLLFDHTLRQDLVDHAFDEGGRNRQSVMAPPTIVHQRVTIGMKIFDQITDVSPAAAAPRMSRT